MITPEIRSVIQHASLLSRGDGCTSGSSTFISFAYDELKASNLLPSGLSLDDFEVCEYLAELQLALGFTSNLNTDVTYRNLVVVPESLNNKLQQFFGDTTFDGELLLSTFRSLSLRRLIEFTRDFFLDDSGTDRRRLLDSSVSPALKRGRLMRAVRSSISDPSQVVKSTQRALSSTEHPLLQFDINELASLTFDFNFGNGTNELMLGLTFNFDSDDSVSGSFKSLLQTFMSDTVGNEGGTELGGFSLGDNAQKLADSLIESWVTNVKVGINFAFGLDLDDLFNRNKSSTERVPRPFMLIEKFDVSGMFGVNEWSTDLDLDPFNFVIAEAEALVDVSASIPTPPLLIASPADFPSLFNTSSIQLNASIDVTFPVFVIVDSFGFGARYVNMLLTCGYRLSYMELIPTILLEGLSIWIPIYLITIHLQ